MHQSKQRQRKTVLLTPQGLQKLEIAKFKAQPHNRQTQCCTLESLSEYTGLSPHTLSKIHTRKAGVDQRSLIRYFAAFNLTLESDDYIQPSRTEIRERIQREPVQTVLLNSSFTAEPPHSRTKMSWGMAPDVSQFYGRTTELTTLQQWISGDSCRLITLLGMGGMGKTWLATKLAEQMQDEFDFVIWRSLQQVSKPQHPIPFNDCINDLLRHLLPASTSDLPETPCTKIQRLMDCLRSNRCLLVLDNFDSVLQRNTPQNVAENGLTGTYRSGYEAYGELLRQVANGRHQSCIVLTSREEPKQVQQFSGDNSFVRLLPLKGLQVIEIQRIFKNRGTFHGTPDDWVQLVKYYDGNPLILEIIATTIQHLFNSNITEFLKQNTLIFDDICELLDQQLECLSNSQRDILQALATQEAPLALADLQSQISTSTTMVLGSLKSLKARSLIERTTTGFFLPPFLKEYWSDRFCRVRVS